MNNENDENRTQKRARFCPFCGKNLEMFKTIRFCYSCGKDVSERLQMQEGSGALPEEEENDSKRVALNQSQVPEPRENIPPIEQSRKEIEFNTISRAPPMQAQKTEGKQPSKFKKQESSIFTHRDHEGAVISIAMADEKKITKFVSGGADNQFVFRDIRDKQDISRFYLKHKGLNVLILENHDIAIAMIGRVMRFSKINVAHIDDIKKIRTFTSEQSAILCIDFNPESEELICGGYDGYVETFNIVSGGQKISSHVCKKPIDCIRVVSNLASSLGKPMTLCGTRDGKVIMYDQELDEVQHVIEAHRKGVSAIDVSPDGFLIATGSINGQITIWQSEDQTKEASFNKHDDMVTSLEFLWDKKHLISASWDHDIRLWNLETKKSRFLLQGHGDHVLDVAASRYGTRVLSGSADKNVKIWTIPSL